MTEDTRQVILVVGGGLAGSLLSLLLSQRGYKVEVFERRPENEASTGRSINLSISSRALRCLREAGITEEDLAGLAVPLNGRCIHPLNGDPSFQRYGGTADYNLSVDRGTLNTLLLKRCIQSSNVSVHYNVRVTRVDIVKPSVEYTCLNSSQTITKHGSLVVGADGSGSFVRYTLAKAPHTRLDTSQQCIDTAYMELTVPAAPVPELHSSPSDGSVVLTPTAFEHLHAGPGGSIYSHTGAFALAHPNWLHIWPRGSFMMIALANCNGTYTATLFMPFAQLMRISKLSAEEASTWFKATFPDAAKIMPDAGAEIARGTVGPLVDVRVNRIVFGGNVVLMGDAAHAMVPFYGQGMNCAFEDALQLAQSLDDAAAKMGAPDGERGFISVAAMEAALLDYESKRLVAGHAIQDLSMQNYVEMSKKTASRWFHYEMRLHGALHTVLGEYFIPLYRMVAYRPQLSYHDALVRSVFYVCVFARSLARSLSLALARSLFPSRQRPPADDRCSSRHWCARRGTGRVRGTRCVPRPARTARCTGSARVLGE